MPSHEEPHLYDVVRTSEWGIDASEEQLLAARQKARFLLVSWRSRFATDGQIETVTYPTQQGDVIRVGSAAPHVARIEHVSAELSSTVYDINPDSEQGLTTGAFDAEGNPVEVTGSILTHYEQASRLLYDCDRRERRG